MNAIDFLVNEHSKVKTMCEEINQSKHKFSQKKELFMELCFDLLRHEKMEQTTWYPVLKKKAELAEIIKHLIEEEQSAEQLIRSFDIVKNESEWTAKFTKFVEEVNHHANEEETKLFPKVEQFISAPELEKIGKEMKDFKAEKDKLKKEAL